MLQELIASGKTTFDEVESAWKCSRLNTVIKEFGSTERRVEAQGERYACWSD